MKTKPTSFRFDENDLLLAKNKSGINKTQKLMDFLLSEYVREFKPKFIPLPEAYVDFNKISAVKSDGTTKIKDITKPERVLNPKEQLKTNYSIDARPKNLDELKKLCPAELEGFDRSKWIATERQKYGI